MFAPSGCFHVCQMQAERGPPPALTKYIALMTMVLGSLLLLLHMYCSHYMYIDIVFLENLSFPANLLLSQSRSPVSWMAGMDNLSGIHYWTICQICKSNIQDS